MMRTEGVFTRKEFNKVRAMLHPDKAQGEAEQKRYAEAFDTICLDHSGQPKV